MIKIQKEINFINICNCQVDYELLKKAMLWYSVKPLYSRHTIFMYGKYPAISIYNKKIHIHRLLMMYKLKSNIDKNTYVHHIDKNKLNTNMDNLELINNKEHQSYHNKGKKINKRTSRKNSKSK